MAKGSYLKKFLQQNEGFEKKVRKRLTIPDSIKEFYLNGQVLLLDKPLHWTSFDVVKKVRGALQIKKVGHAGTLDPLASGLLIVCTGKSTKSIQGLMIKEKSYTATFTLGATTPTYDLESTPENFKLLNGITEEQINSVAKSFLGDQMQKPPVYSAIKKSGTSAYELARRGEDVDLEPRPIHIYSFAVTKIELPQVHVEIKCSTGTYIRSIAHDFGQKLGCGAYLSALRRTSIGDFSVEEAKSVDAFLDEFEKTVEQATT